MAVLTDGLLLLVIIILLGLFNDSRFYCLSECEQLIISNSFGMRHLICFSQPRVTFQSLHSLPLRVGEWANEENVGLPACFWEFSEWVSQSLRHIVFYTTWGLSHIFQFILVFSPCLKSHCWHLLHLLLLCFFFFSCSGNQPLPLPLFPSSSPFICLSLLRSSFPPCLSPPISGT